jgi:hypothetical protein
MMCHVPSIIIILLSLFFPGTSLEPVVNPTTQASACSTFLMMCHVPSMAVFSRESSESSLGIICTSPLLPSFWEHINDQCLLLDDSFNGWLAFFPSNFCISS